MQDAREMIIIQEILSEVIENIFPKDSKEINQDVIETKGDSTISEVERKLSESSGISSGFEDLFGKTIPEGVEMTTSTPKSEIVGLCDEFFNDTIDEAIDKFEYQEIFKEASVQTSRAGIDKQCQCDLLITTDQQPSTKFETKIRNTATVNFNRTPENTTQKENISFEGMEVCERTFTFPKQIRLGLSKRVRLQPLRI